MALTARKIAVTVNSRQHQGISVPKDKKIRTVFVAQYGSDVFCSGNTCCVVKIDPHEENSRLESQTAENGRFREISPVFFVPAFFRKNTDPFCDFFRPQGSEPAKTGFSKKAKPN